MAAVAAIQITVDGQGAVITINNVKNEVQAMAPAFEVVGRQSNVVLTQMTQGHTRALESAR